MCTFSAECTLECNKNTADDNRCFLDPKTDDGTGHQMNSEKKNNLTTLPQTGYFTVRKTLLKKPYHSYTSFGLPGINDQGS